MAYPHRTGIMSVGEDFRIWEGVYREWNDAPELGDPFNEEQWLTNQADQVMKEMAGISSDARAIPLNAISRDYILPAVVAVASDALPAFRILDFGGGLASSYPLVMASVPTAARIEFHVVETPGVCGRGRQLLGQYSNLFFHSELPRGGARFDLIHAGRSFQYVDDWRGLLRSFALLEPKYLILAGVLAGDIEPFVTVQNYYGSKIRVRFHNTAELIEEIERLGFKLLYNSFHLSKRLGKEGPLPMSNFPKDRQVEHPCQFLFGRSGK